MTIEFRGHIESVRYDSASRIAVDIQTPMQEGKGALVTLYVPFGQAAHWLVGRAVQFTVYALPADGVDAREG